MKCYEQAGERLGRKYWPAVVTLQPVLRFRLGQIFTGRLAGHLNAREQIQTQKQDIFFPMMQNKGLIDSSPGEWQGQLNVHVLKPSL